MAVIGATGAIGRRLYPYLKTSLSPVTKVTGTCFQKHMDTLEALDIRDHTAVTGYLKTYQPDCIVWLAGTRDLRRCEQQPHFAYELNTKPVEILIDAITSVSPKTKVIFFSSDYVFDGQKGMYREEDLCAPKTHYGRSKVLAEIMLQASSIDYLILRTAAIMTRDDGFLGWLLQQISTNQSIELFSNTYFSPTPIELLSRCVAMYIQKPIWTKRIVHVTGGRISRYQLGCRLADMLAISGETLMPSLADFENTTFQPDLSLRPSDEVSVWCENAWCEIALEAQ